MQFLLQNQISFLVSAFTGSASRVYNTYTDATTLHSLLALYNFKVPYNEMVNLPVSEFTRKKLKNCSIFIVDEFSLVPGTLLGVMIRRLCKIRKVNEPDYGILLCGDRAQVPCVANYALWHPVTDGMDALTVEGLKLFQNPTYKIALHTPVRTAEDADISIVGQSQGVLWLGV